MPHTDIFISRYIISIVICRKNCNYKHSIRLTKQLLPLSWHAYMKRGFHGNHINLQTKHFHSICDNVWGQVYLVTFCIGFTYLLYLNSSIMLAYDFYLEIEHIFSPYLSKRPSICDVVHSDVQVRMRDSKTRQIFM